jgi:hypothetical protein
MKYISSDNVSKKGGANLEIPTALPPHYLIWSIISLAIIYIQYGVRKMKVV